MFVVDDNSKLSSIPLFQYLPSGARGDRGTTHGISGDKILAIRLLFGVAQRTPRAALHDMIQLK